MIFAWIGVATVLTAELFLRLPLAACSQRIVARSSRASAIIRSPRISDQWKEKALPAYAFRIGVASLQLGVWMAVAASPVLLLGLAWNQTAQRMSRVDVAVGMTALAAAYVSVRRLFACRTTR